jgi:hypothetical protein
MDWIQQSGTPNLVANATVPQTEQLFDLTSVGKQTIVMR